MPGIQRAGNKRQEGGIPAAAAARREQSWLTRRPRPRPLSTGPQGRRIAPRQAGESSFGLLTLGSPRPSPPPRQPGPTVLSFSKSCTESPTAPARALHPSLVSQPRAPKKVPRHGAPQPVGRRGPRSAGRGRAHPRPGEKRRRAVSPATTAGRAPGPAEPASRLEASSCLQTPAGSQHLVLNYLSRFAQDPYHWHQSVPD